MEEDNIHEWFQWLFTTQQNLETAQCRLKKTTLLNKSWIQFSLFIMISIFCNKLQYLSVGTTFFFFLIFNIKIFCLLFTLQHLFVWKLKKCICSKTLSYNTVQTQTGSRIKSCLHSFTLAWQHWGHTGYSASPQWHGPTGCLCIPQAQRSWRPSW